ncbi:uncharacterized protein VDAG_04552 [Verticillium dahliae VdLs.17]|uniref:Chitin-binding type-4 domain-containing protein n=1 Tax=Verticillium dahliae (strain VdLs.17 / ATCC MYA-4575 / FGSC 10137) TaxID=498257 RepID=G2X2M8_VERDV|nr:uncharacterized protein VDAG_04552 [Verticillium dahliae VdLs.17]EGY23114.1 hypothetical protein VDAG_04552 [Verticillium dahliae VdLs.17]
MATTILGHGNLVTPPPRVPGPAMEAACGQQNVDSVLADSGIPLENFRNVPATCTFFNRLFWCLGEKTNSTGQLDLCRGATFADNTDRVQTFTAGQVVPITAEIPIPHEGPCNVSLVDTASNTVIGLPLILFQSYADENLAQLPPNNTAFEVTIPQLQPGQCTLAGECTMQWFWFGTNAQQTYESCVDFVLA